MLLLFTLDAGLFRRAGDAANRMSEYETSFV